MVYTIIIAEQAVITVSENECIYQCDQELNKTDTLKPSVTITCNLASSATDGLPNSFHLPNFPHMAWGEPAVNGAAI